MSFKFIKLILPAAFLTLAGCAGSSDPVHEPDLTKLSATTDREAVIMVLDVYADLLIRTKTTPDDAENLDVLAGLLKSDDDGVRLSAAVVIGLYGKNARAKLPDLYAAMKDTKDRQCGKGRTGVWSDGEIAASIKKIEGKYPPPYECTPVDRPSAPEPRRP